MIDRQEKFHINIANAIAMFMVLAYSIIRYVQLAYIGRGYLTNAFLLISFVTLLSILVFLITFKNSETLAFFIPVTMLMGITIFSVYSGGTEHYFVSLLAILSVSSVYFSHKHFIEFVLLVNVLLFTLLVIFRFPIEGYHTARSTLYVQWFILNLSVITIYLTITRGVKRHDKANSSMDSFLMLLETTPNIVAIVDEQNRIKHISKALANLTNTKKVELTVFRPLLDLFNNPDMQDMITGIIDGELSSGDTVKVMVDGEERYYRVISAATKAVTQDRLIEISDVTPIMEARNQAERASNAKSEFLSNMSHEIRTPMNAIISMANIAKNTDDSGRKDDCLAKINTASNHLLGIINDILDMSKIEADKLELDLRPLDFTKMTHDSINIISVRSEEKGQKLSVNLDDSLPRFIIGDELRLKQVIANLLSNAIKFTPQGGDITLAATGGDAPNTIRISVTDTGIGIKEEEQERLFKAFEQAEAGTTRKFGGTGLGLVISKQIVEKMNGRIWIESKPGEGTSAIFIFEYGKCEDKPDIKAYSPPQASLNLQIFNGKTILIAEDVEINREVMSILLEDTGLVIEFASNGVEAVSMFKKNPDKYDIIIMDIQMPEMDGYDATRVIRSIGTKEAMAIPIIALTANVFKEDIEKCLEAGMNSHLGKPVDFDAMIGTLGQYL